METLSGPSKQGERNMLIRAKVIGDLKEGYLYDPLSLHWADRWEMTTLEVKLTQLITLNAQVITQQMSEAKRLNEQPNFALVEESIKLINELTNIIRDLNRYAFVDGSVMTARFDGQIYTFSAIEGRGKVSV